MKQITFIFTFLWITSTVFAQSEVMKNHDHTSPQQALFVELGGQGLFLTINYDTRFSRSNKGLGGRIGIGYFPFFDFDTTTIPVGLNYLTGKNGKYFETGVGATYIKTISLFGSDDVSGIAGTVTFGFRLQPEKGGFNFRAAVTPFYGPGGFLPYGGISLGYTFP